MPKIKKRIKELENELINLRRDFHKFPELGFRECRTSEKIVNYLKSLNLKIELISKTGVVGLLNDKSNEPTLLLRADIDALPLEEKNKISYKSNNNGIMHACGHDGHIAMLLIAAKILSENRNRLKGNIKLLFQPDEEGATGAKKMIKEGVLDNPKVNAAIGLHLWTPLESGKIGIKAGVQMAALSSFKILIKGKGGHTGFPQNTVDPIITAADIIRNIQLLQTRKINPMNSTIIMFGKIIGGTTYNIVPDKVQLEGTLRYLYDEKVFADENIVEKIEKIINETCSMHGADYEFIFKKKNKAVLNDQKMINLINSVSKKVLSIKKVVPYICTASEDFSEFSSKVPSVFYFLGAGNKGKKTNFPHHNSYFNIDEDVLASGVELHVRSALNFFDQYKTFR